MAQCPIVPTATVLFLYDVVYLPMNYLVCPYNCLEEEGTTGPALYEVMNAELPASYEGRTQRSI